MKNLWLGLGCQRGVSTTHLMQTLAQFSTDQAIDLSWINGVATIDHKAQEPSIMAICHQYQWLLRWFTAAELAAVTIPHPTPEIIQHVGTASVAEAAALLAVLPGGELLVSKQIYRCGNKAVTIAVAQPPDRMG